MKNQAVTGTDPKFGLSSPVDGSNTHGVNERWSDEKTDLTILTLGEQPVTLKSLEPLPQWMPWRTLGSSKVPLSIRPNEKGDGFNPKKWGTHEQLAFRMHRDRALHEGIGLGALQDNSGLYLCGIDLDSCYEELFDDALKPWADDILKRFDTYAEVSPSGKGVKAFFLTDGETYARLTDAMGDRKRVAWSRGEHCEIGLDRERFYTVTRNRVSSCPETLRLVPFDDMEWLLKVAGPAFGDASEAADGTKAGVDRSAEAFRFAANRLRENPELTQEDMIALMRAESGPVGEWATEQCKRDGTPCRC
ncbi:hypothetical protein AA0472_1386 [Acetobacter estunensis NRIC 0472]|uniref:DNA primase/polymerase bifunctional N-terminal domain-containing protein n=1 Tax=Acetobacter estunensis TaxID=104097 RepID=A0A967B5L4_9PROT|nr:hypothetical protein [Acetobacter estunensis]NHO54222.1 hypothetical protein [Acetobacter estunensis]GBQ24325.1 hypothetical protein AA0472_1386 [Acetobacter estunensis NRIC 0472]